MIFEFIPNQTYFLVMLLIWLIGINVFRKEILNPYTEAGTIILLVGLCWPAVLILGVAIIISGGASWVIIRLFKYNL